MESYHELVLYMGNWRLRRGLWLPRIAWLVTGVASFRTQAVQDLGRVIVFHAHVVRWKPLNIFM